MLQQLVVSRRATWLCTAYDVHDAFVHCKVGHWQWRTGVIGWQPASPEQCLQRLPLPSNAYSAGLG